MPVQTITFGQTIDRMQADLHFDRLIQIKKRSSEKIREALKGDDEAIRYYCGRENHNAVTEDLSYIFDRAALDRLIANIDKGDAQGIIIFNGVRSREDSRLPDGSFNDVDGRPTLMMFPCRYHFEKQGTEDIYQFENLLTEGEEHPGTGDGSGTTPSPLNNPARVPDLYQMENVHALALK